MDSEGTSEQFLQTLSFYLIRCMIVRVRYLSLIYGKSSLSFDIYRHFPSSINLMRREQCLPFIGDGLCSTDGASWDNVGSLV